MSARSKNYIEREKCQFLALLEKYKHIIDNKSTSTEIVNKKKEAWESITKEFNSNTETQRTPQQLHNFYNNLRRTCRQAVDKKNGQAETQINVDAINRLNRDLVANKISDTATPSSIHKSKLSDSVVHGLNILSEKLKPLKYMNYSDSSYDETFETITDEPIEIESENNKKTKKRTIIKSGETTLKLKNLFYRRKLECAAIERKTRTLDFKAALKRNKILDLELKIKELEYEKMLMN